MSEPIIRVEHLSKLYRLGRKEERARTLVEAVGRFASAPLQNYRRLRSLTHFEDATKAGDILWALKDVSFEVARGEVLGVIGRNGAGKSTLLKILSRIMPPSKGRVEIHGRLASLLEVGTGFHPELSGRDNVFLNGAILGMTRREIQKKFDEIIAFAEIENFVDTPVKRYSSGMYVRLAFAVAAHLEPEILIVDEVLAVGDAQFQKKCLGKMGDVAKQGRTILFVSHNMAAVRRLCGKVLLLRDGSISQEGDFESTIDSYFGDGAHSGRSGVRNIKAEHHPFILNSVEILNAKGNPSVTLSTHEAFRVRITYEVTEAMPRLRVGFRLHAQDSTVVLSTGNWDSMDGKTMGCDAGGYVAEVEFPAQYLNRGHYYLWLGVDIPMVCPVLGVDQAANFAIEKTSFVAGVDDSRLGLVTPILPWITTKIAP